MEKFNIVVPPMGESVKSGTLVQWEKSVGDFVDLDDVVAVIETDKVSMDVRCDKAGYLVKTLVQPDETVKVGSVIAEMDTEKKCFVCLQTITEQLKI
ncbi:uncharacterized protein [Blastocystis hominis]|uniref:Lipoyl-binding domain-containing protein n=1 Tax=Blastocystis hominis TaxID=12968 RepID=D8M127_BLAHO|nr:uncharacterized protein [Blastocystis hominis]CBK21766.2 unnamed protein product [Blastocystis hominis]|eukprot:XP_012895814.1 uncharacterized protein [Blastocystis hominis]